MIGQILDCLLAGMRLGFYAFLKALPFYEQLSGIKEQLIAYAIGVPVAVVSFVLFLPTLIKIGKRLFT